MTALDWLTARPVAHRGLHDRAQGRIENSLSAVAAAIERGFSVEVDLQGSADDIAMVFHDDTLDRLTDETGPLHARQAEALRRITLAGTGDHIPSLADLLALVDGRIGLVLEVKSRFRPDPALIDNIVATLAGYRGPVAIMSFDPDIVAEFRRRAPTLTRGIVACATSPRDPEWRRLTLMDRFILRHLLHAPRSRPDFVAYDVAALPAIATLVMRGLFKKPILTWTVRTGADRARAGRWADQIIFEGFVPDA